MSLSLDLEVLQTQLFDTAKKVSSDLVSELRDEAVDLYEAYQKDLKDYTDNLAALNKEIAEASDTEIKEIKLESIRLQERAIDSLVDRYQMLFTARAAEQLKGSLKTIGLTAGKIAFSLLIAAV